jgi:hypothetical protein
VRREWRINERRRADRNERIDEMRASLTEEQNMKRDSNHRVKKFKSKQKWKQQRNKHIENCTNSERK